jgi:hypothetical protein
MTFLERRHPDRWARRSEDTSSPRVMVVNVKESAVQVQLYTPSPQSLSDSVSPSLLPPMQGEAVTD